MGVMLGSSARFAALTTILPYRESDSHRDVMGYPQAMSRKEKPAKAKKSNENLPDNPKFKRVVDYFLKTPKLDAQGKASNRKVAEK